MRRVGTPTGGTAKVVHEPRCFLAVVCGGDHRCGVEPTRLAPAGIVTVSTKPDRRVGCQASVDHTTATSVLPASSQAGLWRWWMVVNTSSPVAALRSCTLRRRSAPPEDSIASKARRPMPSVPGSGNATRRPGRARSAHPVTPAGLPAATSDARSLRAYTRGSPTRPSACNSSRAAGLNASTSGWTRSSKPPTRRPPL